MVDVVSASPLPTLLLEVPSERIVAASPSATRLLAPAGGQVVDHSLEDFTVDTPSGALELVATGRLTGYETSRRLLRAGQDPVPIEIWVSVLDEERPARWIVAVLSTEARARRAVPSPPAEHAAPVIGTISDHLIVERVSADVQEFLGYDADDVVGTNFLRLVHSADIPDLLWGLAQTMSSGHGVLLHMRAVSRVGDLVACQLLLVPLRPWPTCAFAFVSPALGDDEVASHAETEGLLRQLRRGVNAVGVVKDMAEVRSEDIAGLGRLSGRELDILSRLLSGDRVPAIAEKLFLAQSTVRNHLASIFSKLRVGSQQELIDLFRGPRDRG